MVFIKSFAILNYPDLFYFLVISFKSDLEDHCDLHSCTVFVRMHCWGWGRGKGRAGQCGGRALPVLYTLHTRSSWVTVISSLGTIDFARLLCGSSLETSQRQFVIIFLLHYQGECS